MTVSDALSAPDLFATSAMAIMMDNFGADFLNWEQETIEMEVRGLCSNPDEDLFDKIAAATTVLTTNTPHLDTLTFNNVTQVFNFEAIHPQSFIPADLEDVLWGCSEMRLLEGPEDYNSLGFSGEIREFVGQLLVQNGITTPPSVLDFATISEDMIMSRDDTLGADSIMFSAYWDSQRANVKDMEEFVVRRTNKLMNQIIQLPLKDMDSEFVKNVKDILRQE